MMTETAEHNSTPEVSYNANSCYFSSAWINRRNFSAKEMLLNLQLQPLTCWSFKMIGYVSSCLLAGNTSYASTHFTTKCDLSQEAGTNCTTTVLFQLHCDVEAVNELFWSINLYYLVIWVCEPNISAVSPLSSIILCIVYCHGCLCGASPLISSCVHEECSGRKID